MVVEKKVSDTGSVPENDGANQYVGRILNGRYLLSMPISSSPLSWVFKAADVSLHRDVAVKFLRPRVVEDTEFLERFKIYVQHAAQINHPHIAKIYDWGIDDSPYLVTELCRGESLQVQLQNLAFDSGTSDRRKKRKREDKSGEPEESIRRLSNSQVISIGIQCAEALSHAHNMGQIHQDLSPSNILFDTEGRVKISDFGIASMFLQKSLEKSIPNPFESLVGANYYSAPEQLKSETLEITEKADIFSLSLVLIEAALGDFLYASDTSIGTYINRITEHLEPPEALEDLGEVLGLGLKQNPQERPSGSELVWHLKGLKDYRRHISLPIQFSQEMLKAVEVDWGKYSSLKTPRRKLKKSGKGQVSQPASLDVLREGLPEAASPPAVKTDEPGAKLSKTALVASIVLVLAAGVFAGRSAYSWANDGDNPAIPNLLGQDSSRLSQIEDKWEIQKFEGRSEDFSEGQIISINPSPGSRLAEDSVLTVVISLGEPLVLLPENLLGSSVSEAELRLSGLRLKMGELFLADAQNPFQAQIPRVLISEAEARNGSYIVTGFDVPIAELELGSEVPLIISRL